MCPVNNKLGIVDKSRPKALFSFTLDESNPPELGLLGKDEVGEDADDVGGSEEMETPVDGVTVL